MYFSYVSRLEQQTRHLLRGLARMLLRELFGVPNRIDALIVSIRLELEVEGDFEKELIADPPIHFINFKITKIATSAEVHGVSRHSVHVLCFKACLITKKRRPDIGGKPIN